MMDPLPIACSLDAADLSSRQREWRELLDASLIERTSVAAGVRMRFPNDPGVRTTIERLIALEQDCCAWIEWSLRESSSGLTLEGTNETEAGISLLRAWPG